MSSFTPNKAGLWWSVVRGDSPVIAVSLHSGSLMREGLVKNIQISAEERFREEDPYADRLAKVASNRLLAHRSRFEADLNRPRQGAVYQSPEEAWGLPLWKTKLTPEELDASLAYYDSFYEEAARLLDGIRGQFGRFVVLDLHTYNHRRDGPDALPAEEEANPEINVGTGTLRDRLQWEGLIQRFMEVLRAFDFGGRHLDVRENVRFRGGHFSRWVHETFAGTGLALAVEIKKFFMDEWTGEVDKSELQRLLRALSSTVPVMAREVLWG